MVEQRTENPCVPGSIPGGTTIESESDDSLFLFHTKRFFDRLLITLFVAMKLKPAIILENQDSLMEELKFHCRDNQVFILCDTNTAQQCLEILLADFQSFCEPEILEVDAGESSKSMEVASHLWTHLLECGATRKAIIINLGGGVVTDLGGFVASTYKRGIRFINVPTSLMAMIDASLGGKTGLDHEKVKNAIGTFALPEAVLIFPEFLNSLPKDEIISGYAEMLKHAIIKDARYWDELTLLKEIELPDDECIEKSVRIKESIIEHDLQEIAERALLNFGHSIGHAIESCFLDEETAISHGQCVAFGMMVETAIAAEMSLITENEASQIISTLSHYYNTNGVALPSFDRIAPFLKNDKKNSLNELKMSLPIKIGEAKFGIVVEIKTAELCYEKWRLSTIV